MVCSVLGGHLTTSPQQIAGLINQIVVVPSFCCGRQAAFNMSQMEVETDLGEDKKKGGSAMEVEFGGNTGENKEETNTSALQAQINKLEARIRKAEEKGHYDYATALQQEKVVLVQKLD